MSISTHFCDPRLWARTHFGGTVLGDAHRSRRPVQTVLNVYDTLAGLDGHLGRKGDGPPGWQTLWRCLMTLRLLVEGVRLAT